jgi:hypothetical protein
MKLKNLSIYAAAALASTVLFTACGSSDSSTDTANVTYTGTVDLAPVEDMLVCKSTVDTSDVNLSFNIEDLPSGCTYTDVNGSYSLSLAAGATLKILPVEGLTKVEGLSFTDMSFYATTSDRSSARVVMSDIVKEKISSLTPTQLQSLYKVSDEANITMNFFDTNSSEVALIGAYKEARHAQDLAIKKLFSSFIISADKNTSSGTVALDKQLEGYIFDAWLAASEDENITIYNENTLKGIASSVISSFNDATTDSKDIIDTNKIAELEYYTYIVGSATTEDLVNLEDTNVTMIENKSKNAYAKTLQSFLPLVEAFGKVINTNYTVANTNRVAVKGQLTDTFNGYLTEVEGE